MQIIESIKTSLLPEGRATATAATFELFMSVTGISESNLKDGLLFLSASDKENEEGHIMARRATCKEVADLIAPELARGSVTATQAWGKWVDHLRNQVEIVPNDQKGRYSAMLATAERELKELQG